MIITKHDCLEELLKTHFVENYIKKINYNKEFTDDLINDVWLLLYEQPEEKIKELFVSQGVNGLRRFASGLIVRQIRGKNGKLRKKYDTSNFVFDDNFNYLIDEEDNEK